MPNAGRPLTDNCSSTATRQRTSLRTPRPRSSSVLGEHSRKSRSTLASTGTVPRLLQGTLSVSEPSRPAWTVTAGQASKQGGREVPLSEDGLELRQHKRRPLSLPQSSSSAHSTTHRAGPGQPGHPASVGGCSAPRRLPAPRCCREQEEASFAVCVESWRRGASRGEHACRRAGSLCQPQAMVCPAACLPLTAGSCRRCRPHTFPGSD